MPGEPHLNVLLRGEIFMALASFGDEKTHEDAIKRFESLLMDKNTPLLSADTKRVRTPTGRHSPFVRGVRTFLQY